VGGQDRALVDATAADGTVALTGGSLPKTASTWTALPRERTARGRTASGTILADIIERTRFASVAWKKNGSGFYYTRHPKKGDVPAGEEVYHVKAFYHALGSDPANDPLIFGEGRSPQDIPALALSEDDRWLLITVFEGWAKSEMYLQDLRAGTPPVEVTTGKNFLYSADMLKGKMYITSNEDAPHYRVRGGCCQSQARKLERDHSAGLMQCCKV
jgi:prolyl oligopeptidase